MATSPLGSADRPSDPRGRALFVDDEVLVLDGLRAALRRERRWDVTLASGGAQAIELLRSQPFAIVFSDLRMPSVDGVEVLAAARAHQPSCLRVVLSGHADRMMLLRSLRVAHWCVGKPCSTRALAALLERAHGLVHEPIPAATRSRIGALCHAPVTVEASLRLADALAHDEPAAQAEVTAAVAADVGLAVQALRFANLEHFGARAPIESVADAVQHLGGEMIRSLRVESGAFTAAVDAVAPDAAAVADHAQRRRAAIARMVSPELRAVAETVALLHDVGALVAAAAPGSDLDDVTGYALRLWGLPARLIDAVRCHRDPDACPPAARALALALRATAIAGAGDRG
jgi:CheY-like chemotaxis protein